MSLIYTVYSPQSLDYFLKHFVRVGFVILESRFASNRAVYTNLDFKIFPFPQLEKGLIIAKTFAESLALPLRATSLCKRCCSTVQARVIKAETHSRLGRGGGTSLVMIFRDDLFPCTRLLALLTIQRSESKTRECGTVGPHTTVLAQK